MTTFRSPLANLFKGDVAMAKTMIASEMTDGQIENAVNKLRDAMRKHRSEIPSYVAQHILGTKNLGMLMYAPFRNLAESFTPQIVRIVSVNRTRSPQEAIDAANRDEQITNRNVVDAMPKGSGDTVEVVFLQLGPSKSGGLISNDDIEEAFESFGLIPVDPITLAAVNEEDPSFADRNDNATIWKNAEGNWCFMLFEGNGGLHGGLRTVQVDEDNDGWGGGRWYGGVRK